MVYLNPNGFDLSPNVNLDGWGVSHIIVGTLYTFMLWAACFFVWVNREHPMLRMRNVPLMLLSVNCIHVYLYLLFVIYAMNGAFNCRWEFWWMSIYLPIGIGLFQAQNQQLLVVSRQQADLIARADLYKPLPPRPRGSFGGPSYYIYRTKIWWRDTTQQRKYEAYILVGMVVQLLATLVLYTLSRRFHSYGLFGHQVSEAACRRGWEWAPSVIWQGVWNYVLGPYSLWKIRDIHDIYHWRLQTIITIVAGLPGTPLWLISIYSETFAPVSKYWIPGFWFVPGIMTMQICALGFPIYQIINHKRQSHDRIRALEEFDQKQKNPFSDDSTTEGTVSITPRSSTSKRSGKMYSMATLDKCLTAGGAELDNFVSYACTVELNGENLSFLIRVQDFVRQCQQTFDSTFRSSPEFRRAREAMFRIALNIYMSLVHTKTAYPYGINIESAIYRRLEQIFGPATIIAATQNKSRASSRTNDSTAITPWDDAPAPDYYGKGSETSSVQEIYPMRQLSLGTDKSRHRSESSECIVATHPHAFDPTGSLEHGTPEHDALQGLQVPSDFDEKVFDDAYKSIRYMVWTGTWQNYSSRKATPGP
ncbi:hypothetical protein LTR37_011506 [Vermiconidia calcicola]|uniref:Uncharacterized protein n=1 Tax=Vermiconidia calcicola TaxID=1690605 RepID=A0ACC3N3I8_9PEZI|nr:hypothetical protein LTR37_011506 [Vermiconidia calcicola]